MIEEALRRCIEGYRPDGRPAKGKLQTLELHVTPFGWQAIAKFWDGEWNVATGDDPAVCLAEVLHPPVTTDDDFADLLV